jgi:transposase
MHTTANLSKVLMEAQFSSECTVCKKQIEIGEPVIYFEQVAVAVHEDCCTTEASHVDVMKVLRMDTREQKGKLIAQTAAIRRKGDHYIVPSQSKRSNYLVDIAAEEGPTCTCLDFEEYGYKCKHVHAVEYALIMEATADDDGPVLSITRVARITYKQNWSKYNAAQTTERDHFVILLRGLCEGILQAPQSRGRPRHHMADVIFSLVWRAYSGKSLRRMMSELRDFQMRGFIETAPHFNTLSDYDGRVDITPILKLLVEESTLPLRAIESDFAVDSTGFSTSKFARWFDEKWGRERTGKEFIKCHAMVGVKTHVVTAVEITRGAGNDTSDSRQFSGLLATTASNFNVTEVSADKAYLSKNNLGAVVAIGGTPYVPFKVNSTGGQGSTLWKKMYNYFQYRRDDFNAHYHKRSNVETVFSMIKGKFGDSVRSKGDVAQENEVLCKVLAHNICCLVMSTYELGITPEFWNGTDSNGMQS